MNLVTAIVYASMFSTGIAVSRLRVTTMNCRSVLAECVKLEFDIFSDLYDRNDTLGNSMDENNLENSYVVQKIVSDHKDLIHDVSFDFFGKRMATCSSDQSVKVLNNTRMMIYIVPVFLMFYSLDKAKFVCLLHRYPPVTRKR